MALTLARGGVLNTDIHDTERHPLDLPRESAPAVRSEPASGGQRANEE
jgi:hypothetical protein